MKKVLLIGLAVLLVLAGSFWWVMRGAGVTDAALLLPGNTMAFASLPDLPRTAMRWPATTLAKIGIEPEMKAFLEVPLKYLAKQNGGEEASGILGQLKPGRIFAAAVPATEGPAGFVIGFQFWGGKPAHDAAVNRLRQQISLDGQAPTPTPASESYQGAQITSTVHDGFTLYNASHGHWGVISNNLPAIKDALDRASGRKKDDMLADSETFKKVGGRLLENPDFLLYFQPRTIVAMAEPFVQAYGVGKQLEQLGKVEAVGVTLRLDGADLRDCIFVLRPNPPDVGTLTHAGIKLTRPDTTAYFDFVTDLRQIFEFGKNPAAAPVPNATEIMNSKLPQLVPEAFGPECAVSLTWAAGSLKPEGVVAIQVRDEAKAAESLQEVLKLFPETAITEKNGIRYHSFPTLQSILLNPAIALHDGFLLIGLDPAEVDTFIAGLQPGQTLQNSPAFAAAEGAFKNGNEVFGYLDIRAIFERGYPFVRQIVTFGAAVSGGWEFIDTSKMPETEIVAKHLNPIVYSQTRLPDGYLVESSGPITMNQALLIAAGAGAALGGSAATAAP